MFIGQIIDIIAEWLRGERADHFAAAPTTAYFASVSTPAVDARPPAIDMRPLRWRHDAQHAEESQCPRRFDFTTPAEAEDVSSRRERDAISHAEIPSDITLLSSTRDMIAFLEMHKK